MTTLEIILFVAIGLAFVEISNLFMNLKSNINQLKDDIEELKNPSGDDEKQVDFNDDID